MHGIDLSIIWAVIIAFLVLVGAIAVVLLVLLPIMWKQVLTLVGEAPRMIKEVQALLLVLPEMYPQLITTEQVRQIAAVLGTELGRAAQKVLTFSIAQLPIFIGILIYLVLVPILVFFFLKDAQSMLRWAGDLLPQERPMMKQIWWEMNQQIANYVRGKFVEIIIVAGVSGVTFSLMGLNYALLLGILTGLSVLVPYIGAAVATLPGFATPSPTSDQPPASSRARSKTSSWAARCRRGPPASMSRAAPRW